MMRAIATAVAGFLAASHQDRSLGPADRHDSGVLLMKADSDFYLYGWGVPTYDSAYIFDFLVATRGKEGRARSTTPRTTATRLHGRSFRCFRKRCGQAQRHHEDIWQVVQKSASTFRCMTRLFTSLRSSPSTFPCTPTTCCTSRT